MLNAPITEGLPACVCVCVEVPRVGTPAARGLRTWELSGVQEASFQKTEGLPEIPSLLGTQAPG